MFRNETRRRAAGQAGGVKSEQRRQNRAARGLPPTERDGRSRILIFSE